MTTVAGPHVFPPHPKKAAGHITLGTKVKKTFWAMQCSMHE